MSKYRVVVLEVHERHYEVDALDEETAKSKVEGCAEEVKDLDFSEWLYYLNSDYWTVEKVS